MLFERKKDVFVIKEANTFYCKLTKRSEEELSGKIIEEVFPENPFSLGLKEIRESLEIAYTSQEPHKINSHRYDLYDRQNGSYELKYWNIENTPIFDEAKNVRYILNVVRDITPEILERCRCNKLQGKLEAKTEKQEQFIDRNTDGLYSLDLEGNFVSLNKGLADIAETPESELLKMNFLPFCGPEHHETIVKKFKAAIGGINQKFEANFISGKGINKVLDISLVPLKNNGIITGLYGIAKDITRLRESEVSLLKSERKFKALIQEGSDLISILDLEGKYKFVSETSSSALGIPPEDFIGKSAFDFIHPEDKVWVKNEFSELEEKKQIQIKPFRFKNAKGEWRWIGTKATNLIKDPAIEGIVTNSRDVTDYINSQKAIKESEERYRSFFENSLDAVMVTIPDGKILAANPSACKMFQRSEEELCSSGRSAVTELLDPRLDPALKLRRETGTATVEITFVRKDGTKFPGEITSSIFKDSDGNPRSSMIIRDITEKTEAAQKLKENAEKLMSAEKSAKLGYWEVGLQEDYFFWSDEVYRIWGRKKEKFQMVREEFEKTIHPRDFEKFIKNQQMAVDGIKDLDIEHRIILPNEEIKWVHEKGKLIKDKEGKPLRFEGSVQDVTERRNSLEKLVQSEARFRGLIQSQTNYVLRTDLQGRYTYGNKKFRDDFGWLHEKNEIVGQNSMVSIKEYHHTRVQEVVQKCMSNPDQVFQVEIDKPTKGGGVRTTLWDFICLNGTALEPDEIQCVGIDISARVKAEEKNRFQADLLDKIGKAVVATDIKGKIIYWNQGASTIYGWKAEEVLGKNIIDVAPSDNHEQDSEIKNVLGEGKIWEGEFEVRRKDGTTFPVYVSDSPVYDQDGNLTGIIGISSDMTERKKAEDELRDLNEDLEKYTEELVEANKGLEQFSFIVSHNLRSPVANILGLADLIGNKEYPEEVKNNFLEAIFDNVKRLDVVITDLNAILQVKAKMDTKRETVVLDTLVDDIKTSIQNLLEKKKVQLTTQFDVPAILTVQSYLHSIFYNLITNSIKYHKPGVPPQIKIKAENNDGTLVITFEDNGLGIDLFTKREQVFGLYKRFHPHIEGKGMGLFLVKTQVELLGGKIAIESEVNVGTKFAMTFKEETLNYISEYEETTLYGGR